jgi:hypothetical protein
MPVSDREFQALLARVTRLEVLVRQLQNPPVNAVATQEVPRG